MWQNLVVQQQWDCFAKWFSEETPSCLDTQSQDSRIRFAQAHIGSLRIELHCTTICWRVCNENGLHFKIKNTGWTHYYITNTWQSGNMGGTRNADCATYKIVATNASDHAVNACKMSNTHTFAEVIAATSFSWAVLLGVGVCGHKNILQEENPLSETCCTHR